MPLLGEAHLKRALRQCGRRGSAPGPDGMSWAALRREAPTALPALAEALASGVWRPAPAAVTTIRSYTGKRFEVAVPAVGDRLVHRALRNAVEPVLEAAAFADWVHGYRPGRSRVTALRQALAHVEGGRRYVADLDVASVSEGAGVDDAVAWVADHVQDGSFLAVVRTALGGLPSALAPGSGLAPLLVNLRLSRVDRLVGHLRVVRFADNYCAFAPDRAGAEAAFGALADALGRHGLAPNPAKSRVRERANVEDLFLIGG